MTNDIKLHNYNVRIPRTALVDLLDGTPPVSPTPLVVCDGECYVIVLSGGVPFVLTPAEIEALGGTDYTNGGDILAGVDGRKFVIGESHWTLTNVSGAWRFERA